MNKILIEFSSLLKERLGEVFTTEDSVRYTFFLALMKTSHISHKDVILEYPHPNIPNARIDTYIPSFQQKNGLVIEFKYDRKIPSGKNVPRPQKAGKIFYDIYRLIQFDINPNEEKWFIYLTDDEMANYLKNQRNLLDDFFELQIGKTLTVDKDYFLSKSMTFQNSVGHSFCTGLLCIWRDSLPAGHELRIYKISNDFN